MTSYDNKIDMVLNWMSTYQDTPCFQLACVLHAGVSNFAVTELQQLISMAITPPAVVEVHSDPLMTNTHIINFCLAHNITVISYSTLGTQWAAKFKGTNPVLIHPAIQVHSGQRYIAHAPSDCSGCKFALRSLHMGRVLWPLHPGLQRNLRCALTATECNLSLCLPCMSTEQI